MSVVSSAPPLWASGACAGVHAAGCRHVVYVPDNPLSHVLREFAERFSDVRLILATREEEAFGIAAGLYLAGAPSSVDVSVERPRQLAERDHLALLAVSDPGAR